MNEMIEQAARAIHDCGLLLDADECEQAARAVLEAIREPTDDMLTAAAGLTEGEGGPTETWQAMIDQALADG